MAAESSWKAGVIAAAFSVLGCTSEPSVVFVPAESFRETLDISVGSVSEPTVRVGEPLVLRARRTSGPWQQVDRATVVPAHCWWGVPPPSVEPEVADNVRWRADPEGSAEFNVGYRQDRTREVRFSQPGTYFLTAESNVSCAGQAVDSLKVRVVGD